ncbi:MAG: glycoside hydrolase family 26 protein [Bacteroidales bacterium]|nr:glycoside hydrolase family 26 protein [Bacteroidales bacterium]
MIAAALLWSCDKKNDPVNPVETGEVVLSMADPSATAETKALYTNLWAIREKGWMFGHHDDLMYGRKWYGNEGGSDTKAVCGDYPAVYALDLSSFMDERSESEVEENALRVKCMKEAYNRGMVITACLHLNNPLTGGDAWDNSNNQVVAEILTEGSATRTKFNSWLDRLSRLAQNLKGADGKLIPIIIRPFHEHTQKWSWWGSTCTTEQQFIALWQYFVNYMKASGVHNFIYAISPQMDSAKIESDFLYRWPGDEYVDFIGMDCYQGINNNIFVNNLKVLSKLSTDKKKPAGVTETGVEGFKQADYWITNIAAPMAGRKMSLLVTWRNKFDPLEQGSHYFSVYPGHVSEKAFVTMYERADTFFCNDLPDMYVPAENISIK